MQVVDEDESILRWRGRIHGDLPNPQADLQKIAGYISTACMNGEISFETAELLTIEVEERIQRHRKRAAQGGDLGAAIGLPKGTKPAAAPRKGWKTPVARMLARRYRSAVASMPGKLKQFFTDGERAVLGIVAIRVREDGFCALAVGTIAARARVSRRTVQNAISKAALGRFIHVQPQRKAPNRITVIAGVWLRWFPTSHALENRKSQVREDIKDPPIRAATCTRVSSKTQGKAPSAAPVQPVTVSPRMVEEVSHDVAVLEAPKPVVTKPRPTRVVPVVEPSNLERIAAAKALVEEVAKTRPESVSDLDPWERPEVQPWMNLRDQQWVAGVEVMEPLSRFPKVRDDRGGVSKEVARWLLERFGAPGRRYTYHSFFRDGRAGERHIGFMSWKDAVEFRMSWR